MLEENTFRSMMLIGGIMSLAIIVGCFFAAPVISVDAQEKQNYENIMNEDLGDSNRLTGYQAVLFSLQGKTRGATSHY